MLADRPSVQRMSHRRTVLPSLTHETLKLASQQSGTGLKLLDAIAALRADASGKSPSADVATTSGAPSIPSEDRASAAKSR